MCGLHKMSRHAAEQRREDAAPAVRAAHREVESVAGLDQARRGIAFQPADLDRDGLGEPGEVTVAPPLRGAIEMTWTRAPVRMAGRIAGESAKRAPGEPS
jgi:hypothetical protein